MSGITSFSAAASNGALNFVWEVDTAITKDNITSINIILSDAAVTGAASSAIVSRTIDPYTTTDKDGVVNGIVKKYTWTGLTNGTAYVACIQIDVLNGTAVTTYSANMSGYKRPGTVPVKPVISATSSDSAIKIRLLNYQPNTESDGFYRIQQIKYYLSNSSGFISTSPGTITKQDGTNLSDFTSNMSEADLQTALLAYQGEFSLTGLSNDTKYELAIATQNELGVSQISQTVMLVPGTTVTPPVPVAVATLEYNRYNRPSSSSDYPDATGATVMFGQASNRGSLLTDKVPVLGYNVYRYDVSSNGTTVYPATKTKIGTISSVDVCGNALPGMIGYTYSTYPLNQYYGGDSANRQTYEFGLIDNSVTRGNYYAYTVTGVNAKGEGIESTPTDCICRIASKAEAPVVSADPSNNRIILNVTPFTFNGYKMADASNNKYYYVDVSGVSYSTMERDISGNITLTDASFSTIKNGAEDVVKVSIITQSPLLGFVNGVATTGQQSYVGLPSVVTTMPYGQPLAPVLATPITLDENNIPIAGGCKLSWSKVSDASANGNTGEVSYNIYVNGSLVVSKVKPTQYLLTGLVNGVTYTVKVAAVIYNTQIKKDVLGAFSNEQSVRTFSLPDKAINVDLSNNTNSLSSLTGYWQAPANYIVDSSNAIYFRYVLTDLSSGIVKLDSSMNVTDGTLQNRTFDSSTVSGGLVPGTLYQLDVYTGCKPSGQQVVYGLVPVTVYRTLYTKQAAPVNLIVTSLDKALRCTWDPSVNNGVELVGYNIKINGGYVSSTPKTTEYFIAIQDASGIPLQNNKSYDVTVAAVGRVKTSKVSYDDVVGNYSGVQSGIPAVGPDPVEIISATGKSGEITISWKAIAAATGYAIYKDNELVSSPSLTKDADKVSYKAISLSPAVKYTFRVVSYVTVASQGTGTNVNIYAVDSDKSVVSAFAYPEPTPVRDLDYTIDSNTINLTWTVPIYTGAAGTGTNGPLLYKVLIDASNADSSLNIVKQEGITSTSYSASGLFVNNKQFKASVSAYFVGADGTTYPSTPSIITDIRPNPKPQNISNLVAVAANHKVTLTWKNPTDLDLYPRTYFNIYKSVNGGEFAPYTRISAAGSSAPNTYVDVAGAASKKYAAGTADFTADPAAGSTAITDADLTNGFTYAYKVVCAISSTGAPNPEAVGSNSVIPFGKPRIVSVTYDSYSGNHTIKVNKNGSSINSGLFVGLGSTTNETPIFLLSSPIGDGVGDRDTVNNIAGLSEYSMVVPSVKAYDTGFIGIGNSAGLTTGTWTKSSNTIA